MKTFMSTNATQLTAQNQTIEAAKMKGFETAMARLSFREDEIAVGGAQMKATYRVAEVPAPGTLRVVEGPIPEPGSRPGSDSGGGMWRLAH
ncbi:MAG TPA: hypothetical protein VFP86_17640 [bacterium]|nr:hypothetical protein [bacterium]